MDTFRAEVKRLLTATEPSKPPTPTESKKLYRVQVGAYAVKANADAMLKKSRRRDLRMLSSKPNNQYMLVRKCPSSVCRR
ncbi:TPA: SPOR domain-containing protein [Streptococcus suis]